MTDFFENFTRFLNRSPTIWHASRQVGKRLAEADFTPLQESDRWELEKGKGYFVVRDDAALCAFRLPKAAIRQMTVLASHIDSPAIKLKPIPDLNRPHVSQFSTEVYGSPILHTWLDRDLCLAGRVFVETNDGNIESHLVQLDDYPMIIPSLSYHLDRSIAENGLILNKQNHLNPIVSIENSKSHPATIESLLRKHLSFQKLISFDLFLVPLEKASFVGAHGEFISSYRLDNLTSAYASLDAIAHSEPSSHILQMAVFWDHEEIGSKSYLGAESFFMNQVIDRICQQEKIDREDYYRLKSHSYCLSIDLAHGYHPNYPEKYDPQNACYLGDGVVLKTNGMQHYATSASTAAPLIRLCQKKGWSLQKNAFRSDIPSGSTVGSIMAAVDGIPTVDIGIAGWAMHSIRETIAAQDEMALSELLKETLKNIWPSIHEH